MCALTVFYCCLGGSQGRTLLQYAVNGLGEEGEAPGGWKAGWRQIDKVL
jgi:hypothetical protein